MTPADELKEQTRAAHAALKDLKKERAAIEKLLAGIPDRVEERIGAEIREGLGAYRETLAKAMDDATAKVFREFDKLSKAILGGTKNRPSLIEMTKRMQS